MDLKDSVPKSPAVRCVAYKPNGNRCKSMTIYASQRCVVHGGSPKSVRQLKKQLMGLAPAAISVFEEALATEPEPCALCGRGVLTQRKLKVAASVLDRTGHGPGMTIEVEAKVTHEVLVEHMTDEEFQAVDEIMTRVMARASQDLEQDVN